MSNMKFKVSSNASDAPPNVGSILSAHVIGLMQDPISAQFNDCKMKDLPPFAHMNFSYQKTIRHNDHWLSRLIAFYEKVETFRLIVLLMSLASIFVCQTSLANQEPEPLFELNYLTFNESYFVIKVYADGKVHYHGNKVTDRNGELYQYVAVLGDQYEKLAPEQVEELRIAFLSLPFKELIKYEKKMPAKTWAKVVKYKDAYTEIRINNAIFFLAITTKLNKFVDVKKWVCFPESQSKQDDCLIHDLPDNFEY